MAFPVQVVIQPAVLEGQQNGRLDPGILKATPGVAGGPPVELVEPAARAWRALSAAALKAGHTLKMSGYHSAYRPYEVQERIFRERYTTTPNGTSGRFWLGQYWYKKPGVAAAAVPGTSNHGRGLAIDVGEERDDDTGTESIDAGTLAWLVANEGRFGFSHEIQSEPWHIRYYTGDTIPRAVRDYEDSLKRPTPAEDDDVRYLVTATSGPNAGKWYITDGIFKRYVDDRIEAGILVGSKLVIAKDGLPYPWPAVIVDDLKNVADI